MADFVKYRWASAKVGVSMALLAFIAGVADKAHAATHQPKATAAFGYLKLSGLPKTISYDFNKLDQKLIKLTNRLSKFEAKVVRSERTQTALNKKFLKITDANATFLKIADASAKFLKIDGTAADSKKLGGIPASAFFQGKGNVVSGALSSVTTKSQQLLSLPGGIIVVSISNTPGADSTIAIQNNTGTTLAAVVDKGSGPTSVGISPNAPLLLPLVPPTAEIRIQIFPGGTFTDVVSILIGLTPNPSNSNVPEAVAQAFTGGV